MLGDFDVVPLPSGGYELFSGRTAFSVEFAEPREKAMFDLLLEYRTKSSKDLVRRLLKLYERDAVYSFFDKLKNAGLVFYTEEVGLTRGDTSDLSESLGYQLRTVATSDITIISASPFGPLLKSFEIFANAKLVEAGRLVGKGGVSDIFERSSLVVIDAASYNPAFLLEANRTAMALNRPWLLVQGAFDRQGHVGPLFVGRDTGCYKCLSDRLRSNVTALDTYDRYEAWLDDGDRLSKSAPMPSQSFSRYLAAIAALETEKFLLGYEVPQTYGYLLSVSPRDYSVQQHRLYKVPFCEVCNKSFEYRRAPWLDAVTLNAQ